MRCSAGWPWLWGDAAAQLFGASGTAQLARDAIAALFPHDGLAVVNQPDGYGLHIFLETDTSDPAMCRPRWLPDPARLFNGNGSTPFSSGLATRAEFFAAVARKRRAQAVEAGAGSPVPAARAG